MQILVNNTGELGTFCLTQPKKKEKEKKDYPVVDNKEARTTDAPTSAVGRHSPCTLACNGAIVSLYARETCQQIRKNCPEGERRRNALAMSVSCSKGRPIWRHLNKDAACIWKPTIQMFGEIPEAVDCPVGGTCARSSDLPKRSSTKFRPGLVARRRPLTKGKGRRKKRPSSASCRDTTVLF